MDFKRGEKRKEVARDLPAVDALDVWKKNDGEGTSSAGRRRKAVLREILNLSPEKIESFLKAVKESPDVVRVETDPLMFLRCQTRPDNCCAAAIQLAEYWRFRCDLFQERAYLPMNTTILTEKEKEIMRTGVYAFLPQDDLERCVLFIDYNRHQCLEEESQAGLRVLFCLLSLVACVTDRVVSMALGYSQRKKNLKHVLGSARMQLIPILFDATMIIIEDKTRKSKQAFPHEKACLDEAIPGSGSLLVNPTAQELEDRGFSPDGIPPSCGGTWHYDSFFYWIEQTEKLQKTAPFSVLESRPPKTTADSRASFKTYADPTLQRLAQAVLLAYQKKSAA